MNTPASTLTNRRYELPASTASRLTQVASRYTHVFQADGCKWQLVSAQGTPISSSV